MKRIIGLTMTLALILGITASGFAGAGPKTKIKPAAAKNVLALKSKKTVKQKKHRRHRRHHHKRKMMTSTKPATMTGKANPK